MTIGRVVAGAGVLAALAASATLAGAARASAQPPLSDQSVTVTVVDMSPTTAAYTPTPRPLHITLSITNDTDQQLYDVSLDVEREAPVSQQARLEQLIKNPQQSPDRSTLSPLPRVDVGSLSPHQTKPLVYKTTTSSQDDGKSICLCFEDGGGVYPINFTARAAADPDGATTEVGFAQAYLPAFKDAPKPVQVSWVWPLIDRPHRLLDGNTFVDDDLAKSVSHGGRLDRALSVVEQVATKVRLTLVIDPELIDELAVMSQPYTVDEDGKLVHGTGTDAARDWLKRLRDVIALATSTEVSLTPYADPDIDAVTASGLTWSDNVGVRQQAQVLGTLGIPASSNVVWPAGGTISSDALRQVLSRRNTAVVVVNDATLPGASQQYPRPDALAPLPARYGAPGAVAAVTDSTLQGLSDQVLDGKRTATLPSLVSDLAVRAAQDPDRPHYVTITANRYVDASPAVAARAILGTAHTPWSTSLTLAEAAESVAPVDHGKLADDGTETQMPPEVIDTAQAASDFVRSFSTALSTSDANSLLGQMPSAIQRAESSAWRLDPQRGLAFAGALKARIAAWRTGVYILRPSSGTYTLASDDAPLPITVVNTLPVDVHVRVSLTSVNGVAGFSSDDSHILTIPRAPSPADPTRTTLKIQTHVQRAGTFRVDASLHTPDGAIIGRPLPPLSIHSTALGAVGVIITAVAAGVLVVALAVRVVRRVRARPGRVDTVARPDPAGVGS